MIQPILIFGDRAVNETEIVPARIITEVAETDPHVVMQRVWYDDRYAQPHDSVRQSKRVDVPIA